MASETGGQVSSLRSFWTFLRHFFHYCFILRAILGMQLAMVLVSGAIFARCEQIDIGEGFYFSIITSTTVGYGDITPSSAMGRWISVFMALTGTILFGLVVAVATQAFTKTIKEYYHPTSHHSDGDTSTSA